MIGNRQQQPRFQSEFYRNHYRKILNALMVNSFIILFLIVLIIYFIVVHPAPNYYASTTNGQIIPMKSMSKT